MNEARRLSLDELQAGLDHIRRSPGDRGTVVFIVRRPDTLKREVIAEAQLDLALGLVGDNWKAHGYRRSPDGSAHPDMQITVMNAQRHRAIGASRGSLGVGRRSTLRRSGSQR